MATDGPDPPPCNCTVFDKGKTVIVVATRGACAFERWVKEVQDLSGQQVDWHYFGGRAFVLYLGDFATVVATIAELKQSLPGDILAWADESGRIN